MYMRVPEMDRWLSHVFKGNTLFVPDLRDPTEFIEEPQSLPPQWMPILLPARGSVYQGNQLIQGALPIESLSQGQEALILTADFTLVHIDENGFITSKKGDTEINHGQIAKNLPSSPLEKEKMLTFHLSPPPTSSSSYFSPDSPVVDIIIYNSSPDIPEGTQTNRRKAATNLYSFLLHRYMK